MAYILIIDDDRDIAEAEAKVLEKEGHEVKIELDIPSAWRSLEVRPPELIILDVMFPEDNAAGFNLARKISKDKILRNIPVLMLTAVNTKFPLGFSQQDIDSSWLPVSEFLEKPINFEILRERVSHLLSKANNKN